MKTNWRAYPVAVVVLACLAWLASPVQGDPGATVRVEAVVTSRAVQIDAKASGPFEYTTYRPSENLFVVDLAGVAPATPSGARVLKSDVVSSYRILRYQSGERNMVRVEILLRAPVEPRVERVGENHLAIVFEGSGPQGVNPPEAKPAPAPRPEPPARIVAATAIEHMQVERVDEQTHVRVTGNGRLSYEAIRLRNPDRLVLDFSGARLRVAQKTLESQLAPVRTVRAGQFKPDVARVVIDLAEETAYSVSAEGATLTVAFPRAEIAAAVPAESAQPAPVAAEPTGSAPLEVPPPAANRGVEMPIQPLPLPATITGTAAPLASPAPAKTEPTAAAVTAAATPPPAPQPAPAPQQAQKYTGEPISVNFKDVDLKDFFRLIHEISGLNVVVDQNVRGSVTLVLDDVPWDQALEIVLQNNSLDKKLEGNVLRIATRDTLKREAELRRDLVRAQAEAVDPVTTYRVLSYAKAAALRDTLKRFLSSRGEILSDDRSNMLIIRDIPSVLPDVDDLIRQLDRRSQQVEIEARVVAANRTFAREIGTQFGFATSATQGGRTVFGGLVGRTGFTSPISRGAAVPLPPLVTSGTRSIPLNTNLGVGAATSGASFVHSSPNVAIDFIISALEARGVGRLLSKPKVITQNNEKAQVQQGTKIPVQTVINNTISTQFIEAVLKLEVTPQITADGTVYMDVVVENTAIAAGIERVQGIPALTTQKAETKVTIQDGGTVVIGGVMITSQRTDVSQVPLFGSIPLIGHLFKRTAVSTESQELHFFITPRILPS